MREPPEFRIPDEGLAAGPLGDDPIALLVRDLLDHALQRNAVTLDVDSQLARVFSTKRRARSRSS